MVRCGLKGLLTFCLLVVSFGVFAQTSVDPMHLPQLTQWVTDFSNVLSASQTSELNALAKTYEMESSNQLVAVVFPNRNGNELVDIWMKIFSDNGIGKKDVNNGLLLLISSEEKKIRIIVWYGLEGVYPDLMASQVIENDIRPLVDNGDIAGAIKVFYEKSKQIIGGEIPVISTSASTEKSDDSFVGFAIFVWFFLWVWLRRFLKKWKKWSLKKWITLWLSLLFSLLFFVGIYFVGMLLLFVAIGIFFGLIGFMPSMFGRGGFGWWSFGWWGGWGFSGGGGFSGWWGAGD